MCPGKPWADANAVSMSPAASLNLTWSNLWLGWHHTDPKTMVHPLALSYRIFIARLIVFSASRSSMLGFLLSRPRQADLFAALRISSTAAINGDVFTGVQGWHLREWRFHLLTAGPGTIRFHYSWYCYIPHTMQRQMPLLLHWYEYFGRSFGQLCRKLGIWLWYRCRNTSVSVVPV